MHLWSRFHASLNDSTAGACIPSTVHFRGHSSGRKIDIVWQESSCCGAVIRWITRVSEVSLGRLRLCTTDVRWFMGVLSCIMYIYEIFERCSVVVKCHFYTIEMHIWLQNAHVTQMHETGVGWIKLFWERIQCFTFDAQICVIWKVYRHAGINQGGQPTHLPLW